MTLVFKGGVYDHIECNHCGQAAPTFAEMAVRKSHGLAAEGWNIDGGIHLCPEHFTEEATSAPPKYEE